MSNIDTYCRHTRIASFCIPYRVWIVAVWICEYISLQLVCHFFFFLNYTIPPEVYIWTSHLPYTH
ncbi:hypothetical protein EON63_21870 [archaeon]|nr:MAG: hypothetical protein EON63_21870 [archaeon]